ncbi:MAG: ACT domain-containing protein [Bacteroidota bacterium]|nr:ACT domain-containing protein [Bacteroidota bacterium]
MPDNLSASSAEQKILVSDTTSSDSTATVSLLHSLQSAEANASPPILTLLPDTFAIIHLSPHIHHVPDFVWKSSFYTITRSSRELSLVCEERLVVRNLSNYGLGSIARIESNWRIVRLEKQQASLAMNSVQLAKTLAEAAIPVHTVSTLDTDYIMVRQSKLAVFVDTVRSAGYSVVQQVF